jgi:hypothetical protein
MTEGAGGAPTSPAETAEPAPQPPPPSGFLPCCRTAPAASEAAWTVQVIARVLNCDRCSCDELATRLAATPSLYLHNVADLSPLADQAHLTSLRLRGGSIARPAPLAPELPASLDLAPLAGVAGLEELELPEGKELANGAVLASLTKLRRLVLPRAGLGDMAFVAPMAGLETLDVRKNHITSIEPVAALTKLKDLDISDNQVADLAPVGALQRLERFAFDRNPVASLAPLRGHPRLVKERRAAYQKTATVFYLPAGAPVSEFELRLTLADLSDDQRALLRASEAGDMAEVRRLVDAKIPLNATEPLSGTTAMGNVLCAAATPIAERRSLAVALMDAGVAPLAYSPAGKSALTCVLDDEDHEGAAALLADLLTHGLDLKAASRNRVADASDTKMTVTPRDWLTLVSYNGSTYLVFAGTPAVVVPFFAERAKVRSIDAERVVVTPEFFDDPPFEDYKERLVYDRAGKEIESTVHHFQETP